MLMPINLYAQQEINGEGALLNHAANLFILDRENKTPKPFINGLVNQFSEQRPCQIFNHSPIPENILKQEANSSERFSMSIPKMSLTENVLDSIIYIGLPEKVIII